MDNFYLEWKTFQVLLVNSGSADRSGLAALGILDLTLPKYEPKFEPKL